MKRMDKLPKAPSKGTPSLDDLRHRITELTEENAALRQRADELLAYQTAIKPIISSLLNNPFADVEWLRHKAQKAMRPRKST